MMIMSLNRLEVLADALAFYHGSHEITSSAYLNRNPGNLLAYGLKHERDAEGRRIFRSLPDGYQALLFDLRIKCQGESRESVTHLHELLSLYGLSTSAVQSIAKRVRKVLASDINSSTQVAFFLGDQ